MGQSVETVYCYVLLPPMLLQYFLGDCGQKNVVPCFFVSNFVWSKHQVVFRIGQMLVQMPANEHPARNQP